VSNSRKCRVWIERVLLDLERQGVLEATREHRPPHYHIAVFPTAYAAYVAELTHRANEAAAAQQDDDAQAEPASGPSAEDPGDTMRYRVRRGDSLWELARRYGTTVEQLQELNQLRGAKIITGTVLVVPAPVR
jgi:nucleoid-associated protein YgaU